MAVANSWTFNDGDWSCQPREQTLAQDQWGAGLDGYQKERRTDRRNDLDGELAEEGRSDLYGEGAKELSDPLAMENEGTEPGGIDLMASKLSSEHRSFSQSRTDSCQDTNPEVQSVHQPRGSQTVSLGMFSGPRAGAPNSGPPRTGALNSGPQTGALNSGPQTGALNSGPQTGALNSGPQAGALNSGPQTRVLEHHCSNISEDSAAIAGRVRELAGLTLHETSCNKSNGINENKHCFLTEKSGSEDAQVIEVRHRLIDEEIENLNKQKRCLCLTSRVGILEDVSVLSCRKPEVGQNVKDQDQLSMGEEATPSTINGVAAEAGTSADVAGGRKAVIEKNIVNKLFEMRAALDISEPTVMDKEATMKDNKNKNTELTLGKEAATNMERESLFSVEGEAIIAMKEVSAANVEQETSTSKEKESAISMKLEGKAALSVKKDIVTSVGKEAAISVVKEAVIEVEREATISVEVEVVTNVEVETATYGLKDPVAVEENAAAIMGESDNSVAKEAATVAENAAATLEESDNNAAKEAATVAENSAATMEESGNIVAKEAFTVEENAAATMEESGNIVAKEAATSMHEKAAVIVAEKAASIVAQGAAKIGENEEASTIVEKDAVIVEKEAAFPLMVKEAASSVGEVAATFVEGEAVNGVEKEATTSGDIKSAPTVDEILEKEADIKDVEKESFEPVKKQAVVTKAPSRWKAGKKSSTGELVCAMKAEKASCKAVEGEAEAISSEKLELDNSIVELEAVAGLLEKEAVKRTAEVRLNEEVTLVSALKEGLPPSESKKLRMEDKNVPSAEGIHVDAKSLVLESESGENNSFEEAAVDKESDSCDGAAVDRESDSCEGAAVDRDSDSCKGAAVDVDLQEGNFHDPGCPKVVVPGKVIIIKSSYKTFCTDNSY
jgi:hypothetical protein